MRVVVIPQTADPQGVFIPPAAKPSSLPGRGSVVRGVFIANLVAQVGILVTGAVVRVTGSGLGCPTWPECVEGSYTPTSRQAESWHKYVEFGNRLLTFVLVVLAIAAIVAALWDRRARRRASLPPRPAIVVLALIPFIGTAAQAVLGGVTVLTGLHPATVSAHFLLSMAIVAGNVALVVRASDPGDRPISVLVPSPVRALAWALVAVTGVVVFLGQQASQDELLKWADAAMYQAKDAGRNTIRFHETDRKT